MYLSEGIDGLAMFFESIPNIFLSRKTMAHFKTILVDSKHLGQRNIVSEVKTRLPRFTRSSAGGQIYDGLDEQLAAVASGDDDGDKSRLQNLNIRPMKALTQLSPFWSTFTTDLSVLTATLSISFRPFGSVSIPSSRS